MPSRMASWRKTYWALNGNERKEKGRGEGRAERWGKVLREGEEGRKEEKSGFREESSG